MSIEIGKRLRQARENLGLSIEQLEAQTRIHKKYLLALENGQFDLLPSPIYVRSYLRTYANAVGENPQMILKHYRPANTRPSLMPAEQATSSMQTLNRIMRQEPRRERGALIPAQRTSQPYAEHVDAEEVIEPEYTQDSFSHTGRYQVSQTSWQQSDLQQSRTIRTRQIRSDESEIIHPDTETYAAYSSATPTVREEELTFSNPALSGRSISAARKPQMPEDMPAPEELGIDAYERTDRFERLERKQAPVSSTIPSRRKSNRSDYDVEEKKSKFSFGKFYTWLLIIGAFTLAIAIAGYIYYTSITAAPKKPDTSSTDVIAAPSGTTSDEKKPQGKPIFTVVTTSRSGPDRFEVANIDKIEVKVVGIKGKNSKVEIREQEVGDPISTIQVSRGQEVSDSFNSTIWIKLYNPQNVQLYINNNEVPTGGFFEGKDLEISLLQ